MDLNSTEQTAKILYIQNIYGLNSVKDIRAWYTLKCETLLTKHIYIKMF